MMISLIACQDTSKELTDNKANEETITEKNIDNLRREMDRFSSHLKFEYQRSFDSITFWLTITLIMLGTITLFPVIGGYSSFKWISKKIEEEGNKLKKKTEKYIEEIKGLKGEAEKDSDDIKKTREMTSQDFKEKEDSKKVIEEAKKKGKNLTDIDKARIKTFELQGKGEIEEAIKIWESIVNIIDNKKEKTMTYINIAYLYSNQRPTDYDKMIENYTKASELATEDNTKAIAYLGSGKAYLNKWQISKDMKDLKQAMGDLKKAIELATEDDVKVDAYEYRVLIYSIKWEIIKSTKEYDKGIEDFKKAIKFNKDFNQAYHILGLCYLLKKNYKEGIENLKTAKKLGFDIEKALTEEDKEILRTLKQELETEVKERIKKELGIDIDKLVEKKE